ncbi:MAG: proline--tRNA ligase [Thermaerobacter sp.]|nr:proline--tRNA ligase [Thermaerobacter sp.]
MPKAGKEKGAFVQEIADPNVDFAQWYVDVVTKADLIDYAPVRGCVVFKPYGYNLWERTQAALDQRFKATGHQNAYFPLLIPESFLLREAQHVEGFTPEVLWVTTGGDEILQERLAIRPTSEAIIGPMYSRWVQSYRDLPILINQWCSVVRWEKATRPFLRTTEFLWQEGHTAHATPEEAQQETLRMLEVYRDFYENEMAIWVVPGQKTEGEKFPGALKTYSVEALMGDGRALQAATSHNLGQNFAEAYEIRYLDREGQLQYAHTTSWGLSWRAIGALIMVHGDARGLVLPPKMAPIQVVIVPIGTGAEGEAVRTRARQIKEQLGEVARVHLDDRDEFTPGYKFNHWELRGVPLRLELGPRDLREQQCVLVRRDTGEKAVVPQDGLEGTVRALLGEVQDNLLSRSRQRVQDNTTDVASVAEIGELVSARRGFAAGGFCGDAACEQKVRDETGATIRNVPFAERPVEACAVCGKPAKHSVLWARSY